MDSRYTYDLLPLDTPDADPSWAEYLDVFRFSFLEHRATDKALDIYRQHRRQDRASMGRVTTEGHGLEGRRVVAGFSSAQSSVNCGAGPVEALMINTIAVRPSHRRRGLLNHMMRQQLDAALDRGTSLATLTASEATIYGRFGFGVASRIHSVQVDTRRFAFRPEVPVADGHLEIVEPSFLADHWHRIVDEHLHRYRGAVAHMHGHFLAETGVWDADEQGPSKSLRVLAHFNDDGVLDGFALFKALGWDSQPITLEVKKVCTAETAVGRALWAGLCSIDLVERLTYPVMPVGDLLASSLIDPWAVKPQEDADAVWLRILDLPSAVSQRAFEADGEVTVKIVDSMGYCDGTWRISAHDGRGSAEQVNDAQPEVTIPVDVLGTLWHGDRTAAQLALSGLVSGDPTGIARLSQLFQVGEPPVNLARF